MDIHVKNLSKVYEGKRVLNHLNIDFLSGHRYCVMAPSGTGKTTLFRIILGLEKADDGKVWFSEKSPRFGVVFQEYRLCEELTALKNVLFVTENKLERENVLRELERLLPRDSMEQPVAEFSGGMKRKTALVRALLAPSDIVILDEPFTGLDEESRRKAIQMILEKTEGKTLIFSSHRAEDCAELKAERLFLKN